MEEIRIYDLDDVITEETFEQNNHQIKYKYGGYMFTITQDHSFHVSDVFDDTVTIVEDRDGLVATQIDINSIREFIAEWCENI